MTDLEKLESEIIELVKKCRIKSIKKLLGLYLHMFDLETHDKIWNIKKEDIRTSVLRKRMKYMSSKFLFPKIRVTRDYKYGLKALFLIVDYHDKYLMYMAEQLKKQKGGDNQK